MILLIALYNGRIDISHIVKIQEIILINLTNTIVKYHILMVILGEEMGGVVWGEEGVISFWPNFSKYFIFYVQNILYGGIT